MTYGCMPSLSMVESTPGVTPTATRLMPSSRRSAGADGAGGISPGQWGAFEIKLNPGAVDDAAAALLRFANSVDTERHGQPACLEVITSTGAGGRRDDGLHVIPIGCLGP